MEASDYLHSKERHAMASGSEPDRSPSGRKAEEQKVYQRSVMCPGKPKKSERRCVEYKPVSVLKTLLEATKGVCEIKVETPADNKEGIAVTRGTCFLGKFEIRYQPVFGLFTANHVLDEAVIGKPNYTVTIANPELKRSHVLSFRNSPFWFTCPLLDVTFIEFDEDLKKIVGGFDFLHIYTNWEGGVGQEEFHLLHYSGALNDQNQYFSGGHLEKYHGLHIFHSASTEEGSSGAPVAVIRGNQLHVVAIHTAQSASDESNYNVAVEAKSVFKVLFAARDDPSFVSHHPTENELMHLKERLEGLGLELRHSPEEQTSSKPPRIPVYFTHGRLRVSDVDDKVLIHFVLTSHGWYWSDVAPHHGTEEPNWVPATEETFGRGHCHVGKTVVEQTAVEGRKSFSFAELRKIVLIDPGNIETDFQHLQLDESNVPAEEEKGERIKILL